MGRLREWWLDWLDRSDVGSSNRKIDDPVTILQRAFAMLAGIVAILSSPAISALVPNLNANAAIVLRSVIALVTLASVNYVVTAKDVAETTSGFRTQTQRTYRFSTVERLIARGVVAIALLATVAWQAPEGPATPLYLSLAAGARTERYVVERGKAIAMQIPAAHLSGYSMVLEWSDNSASDFGAFSGCSPVMNRRSGDDRAKVELVVR
jgi:hypothetical protein